MNATTATPTDPREGERMQRVALRFWMLGQPEEGGQRGRGGGEASPAMSDGGS